MNTNSPKTNWKIWLAAAVGWALLILFAQPQTVSAQQWTGPDGNNNIYYNSGKVGIGTSSPNQKLSVNGSIEVQGAANTTRYVITDESGSGTGRLVMQAGVGSMGTGGALNLYAHSHATHPGDIVAGISVNSGGAFRVNSSGLDGGTDWFYVGGPSGNVGIGTTNPTTPLINAGWGNSGLVVGGGSGSAAIVLYSTPSATLSSLRFGSGASNGLYDQGFVYYNHATNTMGFGTARTTRLIIDSSGNVGIGTTDPAGYKLNVYGNTNITGNITASGSIAAKYQDVAEWVPSSEKLAAGTVVVLDQTKSNQVIASSQSYDTRVAGVISLQPGITLGENGEGKVLVATTGRVKVKVDATAGPIRVGDLLVTSDKEGMAKKSEPLNLGGVQIHRPGTLIGKALEPLEKGTGEILVLLSLQ